MSCIAKRVFGALPEPIRKRFLVFSSELAALGLVFVDILLLALLGKAARFVLTVAFWAVERTVV